jgi:superfamily II DNA or RNA helicase
MEGMCSPLFGYVTQRISVQCGRFVCLSGFVLQGMGKSTTVLLYICVLAARWRRAYEEGTSTLRARPLFLIVCPQEELCTQWINFTQQHPGLEPRSLERGSLSPLSVDQITSIDSKVPTNVVVLVANLRVFQKSTPVVMHFDEQQQAVVRCSLKSVMLTDVIVDECQYLSRDGTMKHINSLQSTARTALSATVFDQNNLHTACKIEPFRILCEFLRLAITEVCTAPNYVQFVSSDRNCRIIIVD